MVIDLNTEPKIDEGEERDVGSLDYVNILFMFYNAKKFLFHSLVSPI